MKIRRAKKEDFEEYYKLYKEFEKEYSKISLEKISISKQFVKKQFKEKLKNYFLVAQMNNNLVGYFEGEIQRYGSYKKGYLGDVFVLKKFRGEGIASNFKDIFINYLKKRKIKDLFLDVNKKNKVLGLYKKWGFEIVKYRMHKNIK